MEASEQLEYGLKAIEGGDRAKSTKWRYRVVWREWCEWCWAQGVDPLSGSLKDAEEFREICSTPCRKGLVGALWLSYRAAGKRSPLEEGRSYDSRRWRRRLTSLDEYGQGMRAILESFQKEYEGWCLKSGLDTAPGSGEQTVEFIGSLGEMLSEQQVRNAVSAVSLHLIEKGGEPIEGDPLVVDALEARERRRAAAGAEGEPKANEVGREPPRYLRSWAQWRDEAGITPGCATGTDVVRYLEVYEHLLNGLKRLSALRRLCGDEEPAFRSEEVDEWRRIYEGRLERGEVPGNNRVRKGEAVVQGWAEARRARLGELTHVPAGLTLEQAQRRYGEEVGVVGKSSEGTYALDWAKFAPWLEEIGAGVEEVEEATVRVFLENLAQEGRSVSTLRKVRASLAYGFSQYGFQENPAEGLDPLGFLDKLERERHEAASQMDGLRMADFNIIKESAFKPRYVERQSVTEVRGWFTLAVVKVMQDAMLRVGEAASAQLRDLQEDGPEGGVLLLRRSKTDRFGKGAELYVSPEGMDYVAQMRDVMRFYGKVESGEERIFGRKVGALQACVKSACREAGLSGHFGSHSMRIGSAQDLALFGFSLLDIMLAGRWSNPEIVRSYVRNIKVREGAMATMQRMIAKGEVRLRPDMRGIDVMKNFGRMRQLM